MTKQVTLQGNARSYTLSIQWPDSPVFIYSPQILEVKNSGQTAGPSQIHITIVGSAGSHTETRTMYNDRVQFDMRRALQLVTPDVDSIFDRIGQSDMGNSGNLFDSTTVRMAFTAGDTGERFENIFHFGLTCMHGALDQLEAYGAQEHRRLWLNFPQTFNIWEDEYGEVHVHLGDTDAYVPLNAGVCAEVDFLLLWAILGEYGVDASSIVRPGRSVDLGLSLVSRVENGEVTPQDRRVFTLTPDDSKPSDGVYLRWLDRRGEMGYWLLKRSEVETKTSAGRSFTRYYEGNPAAPVKASFVNSQKADFREARTMTLTAPGLSAEEYDYLCGMTQSPVVERLIVPEGAGDYLGGRMGLQWQRVNIAPGTYARSIRRGTPRLYELEVAVELPERNTVTL